MRAPTSRSHTQTDTIILTHPLYDVDKFSRAAAYNIVALSVEFMLLGAWMIRAFPSSDYEYVLLLSWWWLPVRRRVCLEVGCVSFPRARGGVGIFERTSACHSRAYEEARVSCMCVSFARVHTYVPQQEAVFDISLSS